MFKKRPNFTKEIISSNAEIKGKTFEFVCWVPPVGYGVNTITGAVEKTDVIKRSSKASEQYWERTPLPENWAKKKAIEADKQKIQKSHYDPELVKFENQEWRRRLCGCWFYNNGKPVYLTGLHYMYLNWWKFDGKYLGYREYDREFFYVWDYCVEDENSLGLIYVTGRKTGKTAKSGIVVYEPTSRTNNAHSGLQSKGDDDIAEVFQKAIISGWKKLPDFFRPLWDTMAGDTPKNELRFFKPSVRGKKALQLKIDEEEEELESWIDFKASSVDAYDGPQLLRYLSDESAKLKKCSIVDRHNTVVPCCEIMGEYKGKILHTTTIEKEDESENDTANQEFIKLLELSNPFERDPNGRTLSGCYILFVPDYKTMHIDKYGRADEEKAKEFHYARRGALKAHPRELASYIRKHPFTLREAFGTGTDKCHFNSLILADVKDSLQWSEKEICEKGNFEWADATKRFSKVIWRPNRDGRWQMPKGFVSFAARMENTFERNGNLIFPTNTVQFISACDPFHNKITEHNKNSLGASHVLNRYDRSGLPEYYDKTFICQYHSRPKTPSLFHEDMAKQCLFFGCQILIENNKEGGIRKFFEDNGLEPFLIKLPQYQDYGIPSTEDNKNLMVNLMIEQVENFGFKLYFLKLVEQLLVFDISNTEKYDLVMSAGWTLVADYFKKAKIRPMNEKPTDIGKMFRRYRIG